MNPFFQAGRRVHGLVLVLALLSAGAPVQALSIEPDQQFAFATQLYHAAQYRRAAEEFQRFAFFFPDDDRRREAILKAGIAFLRAEEPQTALQEFNALSAQEPPDAIAVEAHFMIAEAFLRLQTPSRALLQLHNLIPMTDDPEIRDRARFRIALIQIEQADWEGALRALAQIGPGSAYPVERLKGALSRSSAIDHKNPVLAGTLSILPGAGQLYTGRYQDALVAFLLNGALAWAAVEAFDNGQEALGSLIGFVGFGFYMGNIYGAVTSAHKYNRVQQERFADELQQGVLPTSGPPGEPVEAITIRIALRF